MSEVTRALVKRHWDTANQRSWTEFSFLLHPNLRYELPQTREYIESGLGYLEMFRTWPGDWHGTVRQLVCEDHKAVCFVDFTVGGQVTTGISIFEFEDNKIVRVTDYWPDPYEPPARHTPHMKRRQG